jgi:hypothetical protein
MTTPTPARYFSIDYRTARDRIRRGQITPLRRLA